MPEVRKVESQQVDERCPVCNKGWMRPTGIVLNFPSPQFPHKCTECGYKQIYSVKYPYIVNQ